MADWYDQYAPANEAVEAEKPWYENYAPTEGIAAPVPQLDQFTEQLKKTIENSGKQPLTILDALDAGFGMSVTGLMTRNALPDRQVSPDDPAASRIAFSLGQAVGDFPAMVAGAWYGSELGAEVAGPTGQVLGAGGGAFAVPEIIRNAYIQNLQKGNIKNWDDYWGRFSATAIAGSKAFVVGAGATGTGVIAKNVTQMAGPVISDLAGTSAEIAAMAVLGRTIEGEMPTMQDFTDAAIVVGGVKGAQFTASKLMNIYSRTGVKPDQVVQLTSDNPILKAEIVSKSNDIPSTFESMINESMLPEIMRQNKKVIADLQSTSAPKDFGGNQTVAKVEVLRPENIEPLKIEEPKPSSDATKNILDRIGEPERNTFNYDAMKDSFITSVVDKYHPILKITKLLEGEKLATLDNPYELARLTAGNFGRADQFLKYGTYDFNTLQTNGKSLLDLIKPIKAEFDDFKAYAIARRAEELSTRGIETGFKAEDTSKVLKQFSDNAKFKQAFDDLVQYQNNISKYMKDSGVIDEKTYQQMLEVNKSYLPMYRFFDDQGKPQSVKGLNVRNPIKRIKGSELKIVDPIESIVKNTYLYIDIAEKNRVLSSLVNLAESSARSDLIEKVSAKAKVTNVDTGEIKKFLADHGISIDNMPEETMSVFRRGWQTLAADEFAVFRDGKREVYKADPELIDSIRQMDASTASLFTKIIGAPARFLRAGVTLSPDFMARNAIRDQMVAFIQGNGYLPIYHAMSGVGSLLKKDAAYQDWLKSGGANAAMVAMDRDYIKKNILKLNEETKFMDAAFNVMKSPIELLRVTSEVIENATRLGQFKALAKPGDTPSEVFQRGLSSREVTVDFAREGSKLKSLSMITAFLNARVQGMDRLIRQVKTKPFETAAKGIISVTVPSMYLWWDAYSDETPTRLPDGTITTRGAIYRDLPAWQKNVFWIIMTGTDEDLTIFRIPKPFEYGLVFGSLPERIMESWVEKDPKALKDFGKTLAESLLIDVVPTIAVPQIEQFANRSFFTGRPIVSASDEKILPEFQYNEYTTETAKLLAKGIRTLPWMDRAPQGLSIQSPMVVDNYIRQWTGSLGPQIISVMENSLTQAGIIADKNLPEKPIESLPFVKAFLIRYPQAMTDSTETFYKAFREREITFNTFKSLAKQGDEAASSFLLNNSFEMMKPQAIQNALTQNSRIISMIVADKSMKPEEKRQFIDMLYSQRITMAKRGNDILKELDKAAKEAGLK